MVACMNDSLRTAWAAARREPAAFAEVRATVTFWMVCILARIGGARGAKRKVKPVGAPQPENPRRTEGRQGPP